MVAGEDFGRHVPGVFAYQFAAVASEREYFEEVLPAVTPRKCQLGHRRRALARIRSMWLRSVFSATMRTVCRRSLAASLIWPCEAICGCASLRGRLVASICAEGLRLGSAGSERVRLLGAGSDTLRSTVAVLMPSNLAA